MIRRGTELAIVLLCLLVNAPRSAADEVSSGVYYRGDTDGTHVVTPSVNGRFQVIDNYTSIQAGYAADVWSSASIDIRTAATGRVTEHRDQLTAGVRRELSDLTLRADYRFSHEPDYVSHGGGLAMEQRFGEGNSVLELQMQASQDQVGRAGDRDFRRGLSTIGARVVFSQTLDPATVLQLAYELTRREGYQASPYRFVGVGGDGVCAGTAVLCLPETHPGIRLRNAAVARVKRAFGENKSAGADYRLYFDDWGLMAHTLALNFNWLPDDRSNLGLGWRSYFQNDASFYQERYVVPPGPLRYVSRDRELSRMNTQRISLSYERLFDLTQNGPPLRLTAALGSTWLGYNNFVGLRLVWAMDLIVAATVEL